MQSSSTEFVEFKPSPIQGTGGFARADLPAGLRVLEYLGERIDKRESLARCERGEPFIFALDEEWDLDGGVEWNPARFLNHSCAPNCETEDDNGRIWIVTTRPVAQGEELTFNYCYDLEDYHEHPCGCGAMECVGYIVAEEFFDTVRRNREALKEAAFPPKNSATDAGQPPALVPTGDSPVEPPRLG